MNDLLRPKWIVPGIITRAITAAQQQRYGDAVHEIAHPIATVLDNALGTDLAHCGGCAERRERWNRQADSDKAAKET